MTEPTNVYPESCFEGTLSELVRHLLSGRDFTIVPRFGLDVAVFFHEGRWVFIEAKSYGAQRPGGVGFGNQNGAGSQVELLLLDETALAQFDDSVRWAFVDATKPVGAKRYGLFTSIEAKRAAMGKGVEKGKQNNFKISSFEPRLVNWATFCASLRVFLEPRKSAA